MTRWDIINVLIKKYGYNRYLEIGVRKGHCLNKVLAKAKVGVDPDIKSAATHKMTSDEFFATNKETFDICFIDGLHHSEQVWKDILHSLDCVTGHILLHDCNPRSYEAQVVPRQQKVWNGDVWKAFVKFRSVYHLDTYTIDTDEGIGVIKWGGNSTLLEIKEDLTYENFVKNRKEWLNLISIDEWIKLT